MAVQMVVGKVVGVQERLAGRDGGRQWTETLIAFPSRNVTAPPIVVACGDRFEGAIPVAGEVVAVEVSPRAYAQTGPNGMPTGRAGYALSGWRRLPEVEAALKGAVE
ncbi:hypothetical protein [Nocardioides sp.]|uniref:hypothetical protein n=1 Tax=Nocardioides sp. TaxID=35761 RepID=UPI0039E49B9A